MRQPTSPSRRNSRVTERLWGYVGSIEYFPARKQQQDLRVFLAYTGRKYDYSKKCGLNDYNADRIELGMMYRLKVF